jgi:hypothetical protein
MATRRRFKDRPTAEIVVLTLTATACSVVILDLLLLGILTIFKPEVELAEFARNVGDVVNVLIGAVVGYLAGTFSPIKDNDEPEEKTNDEGTSSR